MVATTCARRILALLFLLKLDAHALVSLSVVRPTSTTTRSYFLHRPSSYPLSLSKHSISKTTAIFFSAIPSINDDVNCDDDDDDDNYSVQTSSSRDDTPLTLAMAVGVVSSLVGYIYSKCMKFGFKLLWKTIPTSIFGNGGGGGGGVGVIGATKVGMLLYRYPHAYIPMIITLGGSLVAISSTLYRPKLFSAHDYVRILSREDGARMDDFPNATRHLLPVMVMCCLTSVSGFSLGPEAPMVTAGGLIGVSIARKYLRYKKMPSYSSSASTSSSSSSSSSIEETLAYAGAAGTLTGFMNVPLAGPIFAMEMTSRRAGISPLAAKSWSAGMAASLAGMAFVRGMLTPNNNVGGHFLYAPRASVGVMTGGDTILVGLACGIGGAVVGTVFHETVRILKSLIWRPPPAKGMNKASSSNDNGGREVVVTILKKILVTLAVGMISMFYPQTMFWGEGSLQSMIDGQMTPFSATSHGIPTIMTHLARVDPNIPFSSDGCDALQVGMAKFASIAIASAGKFPGGVIFPLLSNGAMLSHAFAAALRPWLPISMTTSSLASPLMTMSFMAATLTSITRTPLATVLILALTASGMTPLSSLLPGALLASYVSIFVSERLSSGSFFSYST